MLEPKPIFEIKNNFHPVKLPPTDLEINSNVPFELYGEPQAGKTFYGLWLVKKIAEQKNCKALIIRCEKFDSGFVESICREFDFNADLVDLYPPRSPVSLMELFGMDSTKFSYKVDTKTGKIEIAFLDPNPLETIKNSIINRYGVVFVDTMTSVFNVMTNSGLKNFPPRNQYEQIVFTMAELYSYLGGMFITTHEHSKDVTKPYSTIEVKGGKEVERRHDHVIRIHSSGQDEDKVFILYAKRWPFMPEGRMICAMRYNGATKNFERVKYTTKGKKQEEEADV
jgi:hypothetical protein